MDIDPKEMKIRAARAALEEVRSGMLLGLGTGSTAAEFIRLLGESLKNGGLKDITAVCTSRESEVLAESLSIPLIDLPVDISLDLAVDGADEIDQELRLIKGRGAALLREKIVEQASARFIVIADETKVVRRLGVGLLPVEVVKFAAPRLQELFAGMSLYPVARQLASGERLTTDEGHYLIDVVIPGDRDIADVVDDIRDIAGVVETGFFPYEATDAFIATPSGVERRSR